MTALTTDHLPHATARIGTAGWSIPKSCAGQFPAAESVLARYAQVFNSVEINSSFYRAHARVTYERWAASVPHDFFFSVKIPKEITHAQRLRDPDILLDGFSEQVGGLGGKLGPLLIQLPPSLAFDRITVEVFLRSFRNRFDGWAACEPRNASWFTADAMEVLAVSGVELVHADPPPCIEAPTFPANPLSRYHRLHGSPRIYYSEYPNEMLVEMAAILADKPDRWCILDNTASGAATKNALRLKSLVASNH